MPFLHLMRMPAALVFASTLVLAACGDPVNGAPPWSAVPDDAAAPPPRPSPAPLPPAPSTPPAPPDAAASPAPPIADAAADVPTEPPCNGAPALCTRRFDEVAYATTHNAMSNAEASFIAPNQNRSMREQLDDGVRAMMLDTYDYLGGT